MSLEESGRNVESLPAICMYNNNREKDKKINTRINGELPALGLLPGAYH